MTGRRRILHCDGFETKTLEGAPGQQAGPADRLQPAGHRARADSRTSCSRRSPSSPNPSATRSAAGSCARREPRSSAAWMRRCCASVKRCHIVACGTSWNAGMIGKYLLENLARIPTQVTFGSEFRYAHPVLEPDTMVDCGQPVR